MTKMIAMILAALLFVAGIGALAVGITWGMDKVTSGHIYGAPVEDTSRDNTNIVWMSLRPDEVFYAEPDGTTNYLQVGFDPQGYMRWRVGTVRRKRRAGGSDSEPVEGPAPRTKAELLGEWTHLNILGQLMLNAPASEIEAMVPDSIRGCASLIGVPENEYIGVRDYFRVLAVLRRRWADAMLDKMTQTRAEAEHA